MDSTADFLVTGLQDTIDWYDRNAETYAATGADYFNLDQIEAFVALLPENARVLDVGCGPGRDAGLLTERGLQVTGIDLSEGLLAVARKNHPRIPFIHGDFLSLPFPDRSFDGAWSNASLLHLETVEDVQAALMEINRVLTDGGILHILVKAQNGHAKTAVVKDSFSNHDRFFQYFTAEELSDLVAQAGFSVQSLKEYNEKDVQPRGRAEVDLIWMIAKKS